MPAGIFFSKDRREEVIEVEEEPDVVFIPKANENVKLMTQSQWMRGCPEGGEQSFLFSSYNHLSQGRCTCPYDCGTSAVRKKSDFFALYVRNCTVDNTFNTYHQVIVLVSQVYRPTAIHCSSQMQGMWKGILSRLR